MGFREYSTAIAPDGDYSASTKKGATGRYGFSWLYHGDDIRKITGVKTKKEFLDSPEAQDKYFAWHVDHNLKPAVTRLKGIDKSGIGEEELARLVHVYGETGAKKHLLANPMPAQQNVQPIPVQPGLPPDPEPIPNQISDPTVYSYEHTDSRGNQANLHKGAALTEDQLDVLVNKSRATVYNPASTGQAIGVRPYFNDTIDQIREKEAAEYAGMNVPENNINYKPPVQEIAAPQPRQPDPNFPTRDPVTGRVTPALNTRIKVAEMEQQAANEEPVIEEQTPTRIGRLLNGIFGNDHEGKPLAHAR